MYGLRDAPNKDILKDWNSEDVAYMFNKGI
jgi:hypothetical protein